MLVFFVAASFLFASAGDMFPLGNSIYNQMDELFLALGYTSPSTARPWTKAEATNEFSRLEGASIPLSLQRLYDIIAKTIKSDSAANLRLGLTVAPEMYAHSNTGFNRDDLWVYGWTRRNPFARLILSGSVGGFSTSTGLEYGWGRVTYKDTFVPLASLANPWVGIGAIVPISCGSILTRGGSYVYGQQVFLNFPDVTMLEIDTPRRTTFSFAFPYLSISVSRDQISWGSSHIGNFIFDQHVDHSDYVSLKVFSPRFEFTFILMPMDGDVANTNNTDNVVKTRLYLAHRFDWHPVRRFSFAISENIMYVTDQVKLQYLNPSFIYHNLNASDAFNAIAHLEMELVFSPGWKLFTQFCLDQAKAITENEKQPTSWGLSGGLRHAVSFHESVMEASWECAYTTPWLYRREKADFLMFHRYATNLIYKKIPLFTYIGFPYGGDAIVAESDIAWRSFNGWEATLKGLYLCHGDTSMFSPHNTSEDNDDPPNRKSDRTPTKVAWHAGYVEAGLSYSFLVPWGALLLRADLAVVGYRGAWDVQFLFGGEVRVST